MVCPGGVPPKLWKSIRSPSRFHLTTHPPNRRTRLEGLPNARVARAIVGAYRRVRVVSKDPMLLTMCVPGVIV